MARFEASSLGIGVAQNTTGDVQTSQPFTLSGGPLYAAETGGTTLSGGSLITDSATGELPGWLDPDTDPGIYTLTLGAKTKKFQVGIGLHKRTQSAEGTFAPVFDVDPASSTAPLFSAYMNSAENPGAGAGTYNRGFWMGFNAGRYLGGTFETGKQGVYMGFEDNYYDSGGDNTYGPEWYIGYTTPDGSTIGPADLRMFYTRVKAGDTNTATKSVFTWVDIGEGADGNFSIMGGQVAGNQLFVLTRTTGYHRLPSMFTADNADAGGAGTVQVAPADGYAQMDIVAPGAGIGGSYGLLAFKVVSTYRWAVAGTTGSFEIQDSTNSGRLHVQLTPGSSDTAASTILKSNLRVNGNVGFYNTAPVAKPTVTGSRGGNAALASLLTALAGQGLITDSSSA